MSDKRFQQSVIPLKTSDGFSDAFTDGGFGRQSQSISITDVLSEGPVYGLVDGAASIYLNDDRAQEIGDAAQSMSRTPNTVTLTNGDTAVTTTGPFYPMNEEGLIKQLIVRKGWGSTTVTLTQASPNAFRTARLNRLTTSTSGFFLAGMVTGSTSVSPRFADSSGFLYSPARLYGPSNDGLPIEGFLYERTDGENAGFRINGSGSTEIEDGTYTLEVDRVVALTIAGAVSTPLIVLGEDWPGATGDYYYDLTGTIDSSVRDLDALEPHLKSTSTFGGFNAQFRAGTLLQSPMAGQGGLGSTSISHTPTGVPALEQSVEFDSEGVDKTELVATSNTSGFKLTAEQAQEADEVRVIYSYGNGIYSSRKDGKGTGSNYVFYKVTIAFQTLDAPNAWTEDLILYDYLRHGGESKDATSFQTIIDLSPFKPYSNFRVTISRRTSHTGDNYDRQGDRSGGLNTASEATISSVTSIIKEQLNHPYTSYANVNFSSKQFNSMPKRTYHLRGLLVQVPSNYVTREESSTGVASYTRNTSDSALIESSYQAWNGAFRPTKIYTNNPAWVFYDVISNNRYGLGAFLDAGQIDKFALYRIARYCDELVDDGKGGLEPRFTANVYLTKSTDAYKVIKDFATIFRSMVYWLDGKVFAVTDQPKEPIYNFTKGNVLEGSFNYEGTGSKTRANQIYVNWNNPENNYNLVPILIEDRNNIIETGKIITSDAVAFGATSEGQAIRYGRWKLWTAINQTEIVSFSTSINAAFIAPGDIVNIQDADRFAVRYSGRIPSTGTRSTTVIPIDAPVLLAANSVYDLSVLIVEPGAFITSEGSFTINSVVYNKGDLVPSLTTEETANNLVDDSGVPIQVTWSDYTRVETREVSTSAGTTSSLTVGTAFNATPDAATVWMLKETINGATVLGSAKQYKILSISQSDDNKYDISAVIHYNEKFDAVDKEFNLYLEENVLPSITPDSIVPPPIDPHALLSTNSFLEGEEFQLKWTSPSFIGGGTEVGRGTYEYLAGYEIAHNIPGHRSPIRVGKDVTSLDFSGIPDGSHTLGVRTLNILDNRSRVALTKVTILDRFSAKTTRMPEGVPFGGSSNVALSISDTGVFRLGTENNGFNYTVEPTHPNAAVFTNTIGLSSTYKQTCTDLPVIAQVAQSAPGAFISEHAYIMLDSSGAALSTPDPLVLMKYNNTSYDRPYWFNAGTGNDTTGLTANLTGTISKAAYQTKIVGVGTSFTTECKVGEVFKPATGLNPAGTNITSELFRVSYIKNDTEMFIDRAVSTAYTAQTFKTSNIFVDYTNDTIIARVYRTSDGYFVDPLVTVKASQNSGAETLLAQSITNTEVADQTIVAANIEDGTITDMEIAQNTITGGNINAATKIAVYTKQNNVIVDDTYAALDGANTTYRIYAGSESPAQAPFSVTKEGLVRAQNIQLTDPNGVVYFDSQVGFTETAFSQIANATSSRVYNITKTLSADLDSSNASTYQEVILTDAADVTLKTAIPVSNFSKYLSEEYFGGQTPETAVNLTVSGGSYHQRLTNANLTVIRNGASVALGRVLKAGEIVRVTLNVNYSKNIRNVTGATKVDGSAWASVTQLDNSATVVLYFKVVNAQEFSFRVGAPTTGDQLFKAGGELDETYYAKQTSPRYNVRKRPINNVNTYFHEWMWNEVLLDTTATTVNQITTGGYTYTKGTVVRHTSFEGTWEYYEITRVGSGTGSTVNTTATPDLTQAILDVIPNTVKARLLQRTSPTDTSPTVRLDNFSSNTIQRVTSGTPSDDQYIVTADLDNVVSDGLIEADHSVVLTNFAGAVNAQGFIERSVTVTLAAGTYYFDIEVEFVTAETTTIVEGARIFTASLPTSTTGFLTSNGGVSSAPGVGDITSVVAGTNLNGGATAGDATLNLDTSISLDNITLAGYLRGPSSFVIDPATHADDTGTVVIAGNLQVDGVTTTINSTTVNIDDKTLVIAADAANASEANYAGLVIGGSNAAINYWSLTDSWVANKPFGVKGFSYLDAETDTTTATTQAAIASFAHATYSGAKLIITATSGGERHICELLVTHDGTAAISTQYASVTTAGDLATFNVDISGTDVRILATSASATSTVYKVSKQLLT